MGRYRVVEDSRLVAHAAAESWPRRVEGRYQPQLPRNPSRPVSEDDYRLPLVAGALFELGQQFLARSLRRRGGRIMRDRPVRWRATASAMVGSAVVPGRRESCRSGPRGQRSHQCTASSVEGWRGRWCWQRRRVRADHTRRGQTFRRGEAGAPPCAREPEVSSWRRERCEGDQKADRLNSSPKKSIRGQRGIGGDIEQTARRECLCDHSVLGSLGRPVC